MRKSDMLHFTARDGTDMYAAYFPGKGWIGKVYCPYCLQPRGVPCVRPDRFKRDRHYVETHMARVRKAEGHD